MSKKVVTGYIYENGMWYEMYKTCPRKPVSEEYVIEHYKTLEKMKEEQRTCYNCKYKTSSNHQMRCTKGDYWKRIHKAKIPCKDWKEGEQE